MGCVPFTPSATNWNSGYRFKAACSRGNALPPSQREARRVVFGKGTPPVTAKAVSAPSKRRPGLLLPLRMHKADSLNWNLKCNIGYRHQTDSRKTQRYRQHSIPEHVTDAKRPGGVLRGGRLEIGSNSTQRFPVAVPDICLRRQSALASVDRCPALLFAIRHRRRSARFP